MKTRLLACFALVLALPNAWACASKESDVAAKVSISSVQMISDCRDKEDASVAAGAAMQPPADEAQKGDSLVAFEQPCTQSNMQLSLRSEESAPLSFTVRSVKLLSADGVQVATLQSRGPSVWVVDGYHPWDERLVPKTDVKASYKLSVPDWYEVDKKLGMDSSVGKMFLLEIEVSVDGKSQTLRSAPFPREEDHVVVT
jgi:hypothetical protein